MKQVLIYSIQPEHMLNILNGNKTIEVRKRDLPQWVKDKIDRGEAVEGYGYCTKGGKRLAYDKQPKHPYYMLSNSDGLNSGNGKVVVKFEVSGVNKVPFIYHDWYSMGGYYEITLDIPLRACLDTGQINTYGKGADLYAHHFTNITPIEPMGLMSFYESKTDVLCGLDGDLKDEEYVRCLEEHRITKAPQSFMTAWVMEVGK